MCWSSTVGERRPIPHQYEVELPAEVKNILRAFSFGVSFGFSGSAQSVSVGSVLECLDLRGCALLALVSILKPLRLD